MLRVDCPQLFISIHALRKESDSGILAVLTLAVSNFNPRSP